MVDSRGRTDVDRLDALDLEMVLDSGNLSQNPLPLWLGTSIWFAVNLYLLSSMVGCGNDLLRAELMVIQVASRYIQNPSLSPR